MTSRRTIAGVVATTATLADLAVAAPPASAAASPPILLAGNFIDDGRDEILQYRPGSGAEYMLANFTRSGDDITLDTIVLPPLSGTYTPIAGDFDGDGYDEIFWYGPGTTGDFIWDFVDGDVTQRVVHPMAVAGSNYRPVAGDFTGDGADDIFWYSPGTDGDSYWNFSPTNPFTYTPTTLSQISQDYIPVAGHFAGPTLNIDDIILYRTDGAVARLWDHEGGPVGGSSTNLTPPSGTGYQPFVLDTRADNYKDIFWYRPGSPTEAYWDFTAAGHTVITSSGFQVGGTYKTAAGDFFGDGHDDILWTNDTTTSIWDWHLDDQGTLVNDRLTVGSASAAAALDNATGTAAKAGAKAGATQRVTLHFTLESTMVDDPTP